MKKIITIIGCGATGAAQLYHLIDRLIYENIAEFFEIVVFEKSLNLGHGIAYAQDDSTNILNRSAGTMSLVQNKQDNFINWMSSNQQKWQHYFPNIQINKTKDIFFPRSIFGIYVEDILKKAIENARRYKLKISTVHDEVVSINANNGKYEVNTSNGWTFYSDITILALGNFSSHKFGNYQENPNYFSSPYPTQKLIQIPKHARIGIMGSRLSAIDAVIALDKNNHKGKMAFIAREGHLPAVRAPYQAHELKILTLNKIHELALNQRDGIRLKIFIKLLLQEISLLSNERVTFSEWFQRPNDPKEYLEYEFKNYKSVKNIAWQSVLIAMNEIIEQLWNYLNEEDKYIFIKLYMSKWMAYRVGIPVNNAKKIYGLFFSEKLSLLKGFKCLAFQNGKFIVETFSDQFEFDYIINATGNCEDLSTIESTLILHMLTKGLIKSHRFGGLEVDFPTNKVIKADGVCEKNLFAVGNLTSGTYFFTSVLELNVRHTIKIANIIASDFIESYQGKISDLDVKSRYHHSLLSFRHLSL